MSTKTSIPDGAKFESYTDLTSVYRVKITPRYSVQGRMNPDKDSQLGSLFIVNVELERIYAPQFRRSLASVRVKMAFTSVAGPEGKGTPNPEIVDVVPRRLARYTMEEYDPIIYVLRKFEMFYRLMPVSIRRKRSFGTQMSEGRALEWDRSVVGDEISELPIAMDLGVILKYPSRGTWKVTIEVLPVLNDSAIQVFYGISIPTLIPALAAPLIFGFSKLLERLSAIGTLNSLGLSLMGVAILILVSTLRIRVIDSFSGGLTKRVKTSFTFATDVQGAIPHRLDPNNLECLQGNLEDLMRALRPPHRSTNLGRTALTMAMTDWRLSKLDGEAVRARRRLYSEYSPPETFRIVLEITWELRECILSDIGKEDSLLDVVTLSGSFDHSVAIKCGDYLRATWGSRGMELFSFLHSQILSDFREVDHSKSSRFLSLDRSCPLTTIVVNLSSLTKVTIMSSTTNGQISVDLHGHPDDIEAAYQVLTWIVATFRLPKAGKLCSSRVLMRSDFAGTIRIEPYQLQEISSGNPGTCWQPLFPSSVIATDFPILNDAPLMGVSIPLDMMLHLAGTLHHVDLGELSTDQTGVYFKGVHSLLFPKRMQNDSIQWHLVWDENKTLPPGLIFDYKNQWDRSLKLEALTSESVSHYLGYCASAGVTLGTFSRLELYQDMATSKAAKDRPSPEISVNSTQIGISHMVTGQMSSNYKYRNGLAVARGEGSQYREVIQNAAVQPVILFETAESKERGWLVPQLCAILDLINWNSCYGHGIGPRHMKFADTVPNGGQAALNVLNHKKYPNTVLEKASLADEKDITVGSQVKEIYAAMSKRAEIDATSKRNARFTRELSTEQLRGWDFLELINPRMTSYQRQVALHRSDLDPDLRYKPTWLPLAREVPVYFGRNLGELIVPLEDTRVCEEWDPLPGEFKFNYLAATVHCLKNLANSHGHDDVCLVLDDLIWKYESKDVFKNCKDECIDGLYQCRKKPQYLCKPRKIGRCGRTKKGDGFIPPIPVDGAVIFTNAKSKRNDFIALW